jgi:dihydroxyacetone kinase
MGIHNEPGVKTMKLPKTPELIRLMLDYITVTTDPERSFLPFKNDGTDEVVLLVNNLGGLSEMELSAIAGEALLALEGRGIKVVRVGAGRYMTSINLPGFSLTLLLLPREDDNRVSASDIVSLLDAPTDAPGWIPIFEPRSVDALTIQDEHEGKTLVKNSGSPVSYDYTSFERALDAACRRVIEAEPEITRFDTIAGDGDCGTCLKAGAEEILQLLQSGEVDKKDLISAIATLAEGVSRRV